MSIVRRIGLCFARAIAPQLLAVLFLALGLAQPDRHFWDEYTMSTWPGLCKTVAPTG
jgi:hypothetical protein